MLKEGSVRSADPEGEGFLRALPWPVDTPGGRYFAEFDDEAPVTREDNYCFLRNFCMLEDDGNALWPIRRYTM